jgi:DNA-binding NtrC family response regulator
VQDENAVMNLPLRGIDGSCGLRGHERDTAAMSHRTAALSAASDGTPTATRMVGDSTAMLEVFNQIRCFAAFDLPVLITGESGTGKELVARAIHEQSRRAAGPNVAINCAALPATLIASELFGYEKGAFTGATTRQCGHIEHSHGGTLFLDEIGDMPLDLQGYLLRFLQEGEIIRVGGRKPVHVDARVIAATNMPLRAAVAAGRLREDLFYRLNVLTLHLPALRDRAGDPEVLAVHFLRKIERELGQGVHEIAPAAMAAIREYSWPGNIRELIATLRRAVILAKGARIETSDLRIEPSCNAVRPPTTPERWRHSRGAHARPEPGSSAEREAILGALEVSRHNVTRAAEAIGVSRVTFYRMLRRTRINLPPGAARGRPEQYRPL